MTWNPVTGCAHDCEYCYARKQAMRFGGHDHDENKTPVGWLSAIGPQRLDRPKHIMRANGLQKAPYPWFFLPTLHEYRLDEPERIMKSQTIFVCSMADLFGEWVPDSWIQDVFKACERAPQHRYLFLTKNPARYRELYDKRALPYTDNFWFGTTVTKPEDEFTWFADTPYHGFVSIEPMQAPFGKVEDQHWPEWVIVGAETGNRKGKVIPKRGWVEEIALQCRENNVSVFMKESLLPIMGDQFIQEYLWEM